MTGQRGVAVLEAMDFWRGESMSTREMQYY